jgi:hypothetical protein
MDWKWLKDKTIESRKRSMDRVGMTGKEDLTRG